MKILVVNAGSSSLKYQLIDMDGEKVMAKGLCDRITTKNADGTPAGHIKHKTADGRVFDADIPMPTHAEAFDAFMNAMTGEEYGVIKSLDEIDAVGHRIVQGGAIFKESCLIDEKVIDDIEELGELAPLHNPAHVLGIRACRKCFGTELPQVAVFDTSFHSTMPPESYMFGMPMKYYRDYKVRKYGAHGTSHRYVSGRCIELMGVKPEGTKVITCHLGNGCSITAVKDGKCFDTSMGLTPLDGFMMGTRSGAVDPSAVLYIMKKDNISPDEMSNILNKKSGVLGISELTSDNRDIVDAANNGHEGARLAKDMQTYQIIKVVGSYAAAMNGVDAIAFTGGIGENNEDIRSAVCKSLEFIGLKVDEALNKDTIHGAEGIISTPDSKVKAYVIPTEEELMIARDTAALVVAK